MKNIFCFLTFLLVFACFGQKKKNTAPKLAPSFAKIENLIVEIRNENFQLSITDKGKEVDVIIIKKAGDMQPVGTKITPFTANGAKLYLISWTEKTTTKTDLKTEDKTAMFFNVYDLASKKEVFTNTQLTTNSVEKVFLDRNKTASETQSRIRKEGFECSLNTDGTITQKSSKQLNKWKFDPVSGAFVDAKKK